MADLSTADLPDLITSIEISLTGYKNKNNYDLVEPLLRTTTLSGESLTPRNIKKTIMHIQEEGEKNREEGRGEEIYDICIKLIMSTGATASIFTSTKQK